MNNHEKNFKLAIFILCTVFLFSVVSVVYYDGRYVINIVELINQILKLGRQDLIIFTVALVFVFILGDINKSLYNERVNKEIAKKYIYLGVIIFIYVIGRIGNIEVEISNFLNGNIGQFAIKILEKIGQKNFTQSEIILYFKNNYFSIFYNIYIILFVLYILEIIFRKRFVLATKEYINYFMILLFVEMNIGLFIEENVMFYRKYFAAIILCFVYECLLNMMVYGLKSISEYFNAEKMYKYTEKFITERIGKICAYIEHKLNSSINWKSEKLKDKNYLKKQLSEPDKILFKKRIDESKALKSRITSISRDGELKGYSIGISAEWGMGKTYFLQQFVEDHFAKCYVWVTPAVFVNKNDLYKEIINGLSSVFMQNKLYSNNKNSVGNYLTALIDLVTDDKYKVNKFIFNKDINTFDDIRLNLQCYVSLFNKVIRKPIIVIIDDFDRLHQNFKDTDSETEVLQIIYELTNIKGVIVLYSIKDIQDYFGVSDEEFAEEDGGKVQYRKYINDYLILENIGIDEVVETMFDSNIFKFIKFNYNVYYKDFCNEVDFEDIIKTTLKLYFKNNKFNIRTVEQIVIKYQGLLEEKFAEKLIVDVDSIKLISVFALIKEVYPLEFELIMNCSTYFDYEKSRIFYKTYEKINDLINRVMWNKVEEIDELMKSDRHTFLYGNIQTDNTTESNGTIRISKVKRDITNKINKIFHKKNQKQLNDIISMKEISVDFDKDYYIGNRNIEEQFELLYDKKLEEIKIDVIIDDCFENKDIIGKLLRESYYNYLTEYYKNNKILFILDLLKKELQNLYKIEDNESIFIKNMLVSETLKKHLNDIYRIQIHDNLKEEFTSGEIGILFTLDIDILEYEFSNKLYPDQSFNRKFSLNDNFDNVILEIENIKNKFDVLITENDENKKRLSLLKRKIVEIDFIIVILLALNIIERDNIKD